jgi:hypothetical protein
MVLLSLAALPVWADISIPLAWNPSADASVAGYKIYYGSVSGNYTNSVDVGNVTNAVIGGLVAGTTYFFAATSYNTNGVESGFSAEAVYATTNPVVVPTPVAQPPTLDPLADISLPENALVQSINLTGISLGATNAVQAMSQSQKQKNKTPKLKITATSSNPKIVPAPKINYFNPNSTGSLKLKPVHNASGTVVITVTVSGGTSNAIITRSFTVTVLPPAAAPVAQAASVAVPAATASVSVSPAPATLVAVGMVNGHFTFNVNGTAGSQYAIQATSDLVNWTSVATNTAPFVFSDPSSTSADKKFYRAVSL